MALEEAVLEYLQHNDLEQTARSFSAECATRGVALNSGGAGAGGSATLTNAERQELVSKILALFDAGRRAEFIELWDRHIPSRLQRSAARIGFFTSVFFAIWPIHPSNPHRSPDALDGAMQVFRAYTESKSAELSKTPEFLAFFALPFVPNPDKHPSFQTFFTAEWASELRAELSAFLAKNVRSGVRPRLEVAWERGLQAGSAPPSASTGGSASRQQVEALQAEVRTLKAALAAARKGPEGEVSQKASPKRQQQQQQQRVVASFPPPQQPPLESPMQSSRPRTASAMLAPLDWDKIAADLGNAGDATSKATLLEALRWRVSRSPTGEARRLVLQALSTNDPLALGSGAGQLLVQLLSKSHAAVREQTLRLLNALSFERAGRHYLLQSDTVLRSLWDCISGERSDTPVRQQALAALQKLSLSRHAQESIIALGAVEWLLKTLAQPEGLSSRTLEYGSALLLNLSLRASGRQRCEQCATANVVDVLAGLVAHENPQVRYYTDGVLYSVLQRPGVRARARAMGLEDVLKYTAQTSDDEFAKQIEYILMQLSSDDPEPSEDPVSDEDDDDEDDEEQSDDESDGAENEEESEEGSLLGSSSRGNPRGEELLAKKYLAKAEAARRELEALRGSRGGRSLPTSRASSAARRPGTASSPYEPPMRPVTPAKTKQQQKKGSAPAYGRSLQSAVTLPPALPPAPAGRGSLSSAEDEWAMAFGGGRSIPRTPQVAPHTPLAELKPSPKPRK